MRNDGTYLAQLLQEQQRPHPMYMRQQYHFMGGPGWINDPNGLVWYKDAYHFFYQYNPFGLTWGEPCWGHAVSRDLLHWTQLPPALVPSEPYDMYEQGGCFSGCALVVGQRLYLLYTGVCEKDGHCVQAQCLAWSDDGVTFQNMKIIRSSARRWALIRQISAIQSSGARQMGYSISSAAQAWKGRGQRCCFPHRIFSSGSIRACWPAARGASARCGSVRI